MVRNLPTTHANLENSKGKRPINEDGSNSDLDSIQKEHDYYRDRLRRSDRISTYGDDHLGEHYDPPSRITLPECRLLKRREYPGHFLLPLKDYATGLKLGFGMIDSSAVHNIMPIEHLRRLGYKVPELKLTPRINFLDGTRTVNAGKIKLKVKIGSFAYPVLFLCLDIPYSMCAQCTLGTPFLSTSRAIIDYESEEIRLSVKKNVECYSIVYLPNSDVGTLKRRNLTEGAAYQAEVDKEIFPNPIIYKKHADMMMFPVSDSSSVSELSDATSYSSPSPMKKTARIRTGGNIGGINIKCICRRKKLRLGRQITYLQVNDNFRGSVEEAEASNLMEEGRGEGEREKKND